MIDKNDLFIDIETYSSVDIKSSGHFKYIESPDFEILLIAYAYGLSEVKVVDLLSGEEIPEELMKGLKDPKVRKHAHNASFEAESFKRIGIDIPLREWKCSAFLASYCGLPRALGEVSKVMDLEKGKQSIGTLLIKYFSCPCKPTTSNGMRTRNYPHHDPVKWEAYKTYNKYDVEAEREIVQKLDRYKIPPLEYTNYIVDAIINRRGVLLDKDMCEKAVEMTETENERIANLMRRLTGLDNPNSSGQLIQWLNSRQIECTSLAKEYRKELIKSATGTVQKVLLLKEELSRTSVKKYSAMLNCCMKDDRARGLFQFYGANRTGRWAGRLIQLQNMTKHKDNYLDLDKHYDNWLDVARDAIKSGDIEWFHCVLGEDASLSNVLSQLTRTALVAPEGHEFAVADYSAIEARVAAWVAGEDWVLDVFRSHGKIYEAAAANMFHVPIESIGKDSPLRQKGKVAVLACGYGGGVSALKAFGADKMGLSDTELQGVIDAYRKANSHIVEMWYDFDQCAKSAVRRGCEVESKFKGIKFGCNPDREILWIELPSGRRLHYWKPGIGTNRFGSDSVTYWGMDQTTKKWVKLETYGGKLTENIVQAISRDLLADLMLRLYKEKICVVGHVHDEVITEVPSPDYLERLIQLMSIGPDWAEGLPLRGAGYLTKYYIKD